MSRMTEAVKSNRTTETEEKKGAVTNFMGGTSYEINALDTLKMVSASSIFGEPQYYRNGEFAEKTATRVKDGTFNINHIFADYAIESLDKYAGMKTSDMMETIIDNALKEDFKAVLEWAKTLRHDFYMRLNPQVIMVRAAMMTEERKAFTKENPGLFNKINQSVMKRADDVISQITYFLYKNGGKDHIPGILKKSWADKISSLTDYEVYKYKNRGIGLINSVRLCHANSAAINELMKTGTVQVDDNEKTWETLRASGMSWDEITDQIRMNHMALLRNLRGIFSEINNDTKCEDLLNLLKEGVERGMQFPYRYLSAKNAIDSVSNSDLKYRKTEISDTLEECMDISCKNLPHLPGNNAFLSDNSGSAWGTCPSEYGTMTVARIGNLSSVIGAVNSDKGIVYTFGDELIENTVSKRNGILAQSEAMSIKAKREAGMSTESGIWKFFDKAIKEKIHYDNIFIYSDMQAGCGELYGTSRDYHEYKKEGFAVKGNYINVAKLIDAYRKAINPKVNVFCVQTAGYNNVLVPQYGYRTNILYGWTGKELLFADAMNKFWDEQDEKKEARKKTA